MLSPITIPGLLITGTDTGVGKTVVAGAIAQWFLRHGVRVAVCKPVATGCPHRREGLVSEDAEFLASCADARDPLDILCPQRFAEPLAPAVAAQRAGQALDWQAIQRSLSHLCGQNQVLIVEGVGGIMVPMDQQHTFLHVAHWLRLPTVVVARPGLGTINHTLLTVGALRAANVPVAGVVINRYPAENADIVEETNPQAIEQWGALSVLCLVPDQPVRGPAIPPEIAQAIDGVDWARCCNPRFAISE
jgi:dethiobiotin synthetase